MERKNMKIGNHGQEMRFLVTKKCNYHCVMCHEEGLPGMRNSTLTPLDYEFLYLVGHKYLGMRGVTLTGGEPLMRSDIEDVAQKIWSKGGLSTLTTNGSLLSNSIGRYVHKINVSLHVLNAGAYSVLTGTRDMYHRVLENIRDFRNQYPEKEICLNSVIVRGINYPKGIKNLINFAIEVQASIKLIELFPSRLEGFVSLNEVRKSLINFGFVEDEPTYRKMNFSNNEINVALTRIHCAEALFASNPGLWCAQNNDLFISPDGSIKPCREREILKSIF